MPARRDQPRRRPQDAQVRDFRAAHAGSSSGSGVHVTSASIDSILRIIASRFPVITALEQLADLAPIDRILRDLRTGAEVMYKLVLTWNVVDNNGEPTQYVQYFRAKAKAIGEGGLTMAEICTDLAEEARDSKELAMEQGSSTIFTSLAKLELTVISGERQRRRDRRVQQ